MKAEEMWKRYKGDKADEPYEAWCYGEAADHLADLTKRGIKTATASAYPCYIAEGSSIPKVGEYSVVLDSDEEAVCIIKTTRVTLVPFMEVSEEHARREGEGDLSLDYWRRVHEAFFVRELSEVGLTFTEDMTVVCEEFEKVFP